MKTHHQVDQRSLALAKAVVDKLDATDVQAGIRQARAVNQRWRRQGASRLHEEWADILRGDWPQIRNALLDESERGIQLRQNNPFCGILAHRERWTLLRENAP
jgi:hypothetical protein